jgi:hypothetical protein
MSMKSSMWCTGRNGAVLPSSAVRRSRALRAAVSSPGRAHAVRIEYAGAHTLLLYTAPCVHVRTAVS